MQMQEEVNLIPNCSETTFRIDVSTLTDVEIETIQELWKKKLQEITESDDGGFEYDNDLNEKKILGKKVLEVHGDFPYHNADAVKSIVKSAEKTLKKKLTSEFEDM